eukprot:CAMPEP_0174258800 /NCGR_PEP_ID=MMETSP0439-20130205/7732_1 /TAXON_ID=0 /ORGANISM="Stereomyxa ramosa, Strain Chinc5" /LENGTH=720 /DNA_ID=CAMNT_0015342443 /DNA_START=1266 /DNA_END=3428 /DNA_ORIENTATION=+
MELSMSGQQYQQEKDTQNGKEEEEEKEEKKKKKEKVEKWKVVIGRMFGSGPYSSLLFSHPFPPLHPLPPSDLLIDSLLSSIQVPLSPPDDQGMGTEQKRRKGEGRVGRGRKKKKGGTQKNKKMGKFLKIVSEYPNHIQNKLIHIWCLSSTPTLLPSPLHYSLFLALAHPSLHFSSSREERREIRVETVGGVDLGKLDGSVDSEASLQQADMLMVSSKRICSLLSFYKKLSVNMKEGVCSLFLSFLRSFPSFFLVSPPSSSLFSPLSSIYAKFLKFFLLNPLFELLLPFKIFLNFVASQIYEAPSVAEDGEIGRVGEDGEIDKVSEVGVINHLLLPLFHSLSLSFARILHFFKVGAVLTPSPSPSLHSNYSSFPSYNHFSLEGKESTKESKLSKLIVEILKEEETAENRQTKQILSDMLLHQKVLPHMFELFAKSEDPRTRANLLSTLTLLLSNNNFSPCFWVVECRLDVLIDLLQDPFPHVNQLASSYLNSLFLSSSNEESKSKIRRGIIWRIWGRLTSCWNYENNKNLVGVLVSLAEGSQHICSELVDTAHKLLFLKTNHKFGDHNSLHFFHPLNPNSLSSSPNPSLLILLKHLATFSYPSSKNPVRVSEIDSGMERILTNGERIGVHQYQLLARFLILHPSHNHFIRFLPLIIAGVKNPNAHIRNVSIMMIRKIVSSGEGEEHNAVVGLLNEHLVLAKLLNQAPDELFLQEAFTHISP